MPGSRHLSVFALAASAVVLPSAALPQWDVIRWEVAGTTPCGDHVRAFIGGLKPGAPCHAITWRFIFVPSDIVPRPGHWTLRATYGIPAPSNPNAMVDGPKVVLNGDLNITRGTKADPRPTVYRLTTGNPRRSLALKPVGAGPLHVLTDDDRLMVGTAGWSYTLNSADRMEQRGDPSMAPDMSYTISPRATGGTVFGLFEGRTPCRGIARELKIPDPGGCLKVKWRVTLYRDPGIDEPTRYKIESSLHRQQAREGTWRIIKGTPTDPNAVIYHLDPAGTEGALLLFKGDDNVLFFADQSQKLLIGNADFSYTLNRVG